MTSRRPSTSTPAGAAARTDLAGPEQTEPLARAQYASLRRLLALPDPTPVYPTHGAGSFCSAPPAAERTTTIGREKAANPLLAVPGEDAFVKVLLSSLGTFPAYFLRLPAENRRGPAIVASAPALAPLSADQVRTLRDEGVQVIDVRPVTDYAQGHIPGSLAIPLRDAFATWLGWLVPDPAIPLVIVAGPGQDLGEVTWQALKIGYDNLAGTLAGGLPAWQAAGNPVAATPLLAPGQVNPAAVVDVRQGGEYAGGHLPGARNIELGALARQAARVAGQPVVTMCGHGERAATGLTISQIGILAALYPAVWGAGQLATGALSDRIGRKWLIAAGMLVQAVALGLVAAGSAFGVWAVAAVLLGAGTAMVYPTLLAVVGDVAHPAWRARSVGVYRLWRDGGFAVGAVLAGVVADAFRILAAIWVVAALTAAAGLIVAVRMYETLSRSGTASAP
jgi:rhodanese-related sulfurtransferase